MNDQLDGILAALEALRVAGGARPPETLSPGELIAVNEAYGMLRRRVEGAHAPVATEIARQSRHELGKDSLAKKQGFRSPAALIAATTGSTMGDAARLLTVGEATAARMTLTGDVLPAKHPHVAAAVEAGGLSVAMASMIIAMLDRVVLRADPLLVERMEQTLAAQAVGLTPDQLQRILLRAEVYLDPDGVEPKGEDLRTSRELTIRQDRTGALVFSGRFDPETGAPIKAAIDGLVSGMFARRDASLRGDAVGHGPGDGVGGPAGDGAGVAGGSAAGTAGDAAGEGQGGQGGAVEADRRSLRQMQADALADLCRHALGCETVPTGVSTTVVVRMDLADLESGIGMATIDGIDQPVSAATARRMAADAQVIPCVLGGDSEILDWGRAKRLFTPAQKLALAERDGGCAFCGLPPSMTVAHHIRWWARDRGPTDLRNGILLCTSCHHRIHDDGWDIRIDGTGARATVWFIPPPWLDPVRTPRRGGRARYDLAA